MPACAECILTARVWSIGRCTNGSIRNIPATAALHHRASLIGHGICRWQQVISRRRTSDFPIECDAYAGPMRGPAIFWIGSTALTRTGSRRQAAPGLVAMPWVGAIGCVFAAAPLGRHPRGVLPVGGFPLDKQGQAIRARPGKTRGWALRAGVSAPAPDRGPGGGLVPPI